MDITDVGAALLSALLHAGWNAAVKANRDPARAMTAQMLLGAILVVPALLWSGLPAPAAWFWVVASTLMNVLTIAALLRAYELGGFGLVYPVMRAVAVLLVVPMAAVLTGEKFGPAALAGIFVIALSLGVLALDAMRDRAVTLKALGWTLAAGLGTAAYIMCDAQGVRASGNPWAYGFVVSITNAAAMCWRQRRAGPPWRQLDGQWLATLPIALASMASYLLILWVWSHAPIAPAAALRDTSSVFAILIAVAWLKEPFTRTRIVAVLLAAAAVPLLRLG
ncbi:MAG: EamA family transporter [Reyranella sp.]|uniref:EamA family transporter n=1 Tax=Reyranella sp. TaxID=1929291 RepID=UPI00272F301D|nr:EamA family transporter [Reyranella sp.]MDP1961161.1 EamA family transporter [Reyranella sp.]MDP2373226.1 EamA family transporter [Reyranella sp.]